jgi:hypothetical protein
MTEPYCSRCKRTIDHVGIYFPAETAVRFYGGGEPVFLCDRCPSGDEREFVRETLRHRADVEETHYGEATDSEPDT